MGFILWCSDWLNWNQCMKCVAHFVSADARFDSPSASDFRVVQRARSRTVSLLLLFLLLLLLLVVRLRKQKRLIGCRGQYAEAKNGRSFGSHWKEAEKLWASQIEHDYSHHTSYIYRDPIEFMLQHFANCYSIILDHRSKHPPKWNWIQTRLFWLNVWWYFVFVEWNSYKFGNGQTDYSVYCSWNDFSPVRISLPASFNYLLGIRIFVLCVWLVFVCVCDFSVPSLFVAVREFHWNRCSEYSFNLYRFLKQNYFILPAYFLFDSLSLSLWGLFTFQFSLRTIIDRAVSLEMELHSREKSFYGMHLNRQIAYVILRTWI